MTRRFTLMLTLSASLVAFPAAASAAPSPDCAVMKTAAVEYSRLAGQLTTLRKAVDMSVGNRDKQAAASRDVVQQARKMAGVLRSLQGKLASPELKGLYSDDATSFEDYASTLEDEVNRGDLTDNSRAVQQAYDSNLAAVRAANNAFHAECRS